jgi:hypothetical protein
MMPFEEKLARGLIAMCQLEENYMKVMEYI